MNKVSLVLGLLLASSIPSYASNSTIRTQGLTAAGIIVAAGGTWMLTRRSPSRADQLKDTIFGAGYLLAGLTIIVLSGDISDAIERFARK